MLDPNNADYFLLVQKDKKVIERYINLLFKIVKSCCYRYGLGHHVARDITNMAISLLLHHIERGKCANIPLMPWAVGIAKKLILEELRQKNRGQNGGYIEPFEENMDLIDESMPENVEAIEMMLGYLKPEEQILIRLTYLMGYTDKQIMEQGLTAFKNESVLKARRNQIVKKLKVLFVSRKNWLNWAYEMQTFA